MTNEEIVEKLKAIGYYIQCREDICVTDFILSIENKEVQEKVFKVYYNTISEDKDKNPPVTVLTLMILNVAKTLFEEIEK